MRRVFSVLMVSILCLSMFTLFTVKANASNSLVGYWKFDEGSGTTASDSSGNGNAGTLINSPAWVSGVYGDALSFDGVSNYVQIPASSSLDVTAQVTVEAWVYLRAYVDSAGDGSHFVSRCDMSGGHIYVLGIVNNKVSYSVNPTPNAAASIANLTLDAWTYLAMTYNGSYVSLYIDGTFDSGYTQSGSIETTTNWLAIGCKPTAAYGGPGTYAYTNGDVDEVRIYNTALTEQEIQTDMVAPSSPNLLVNPGFEDGLNGWSTSAGTAVYSVDNTTSHSGSFSAKGVETNTGSLGRLLQDVTNRVSSGDQIQISGWIKTANVTGQVVIGLGYVDTNGVYPLDDIFGEEKYEIGYVTGNQDWGFYQSPVFTLGPMPSDAVGLAFLFDFNNGAGTAWWDDVSLVSLSPSPVQSSTSVFCSPNPALVGSSITCTTTVFGSNPTGTVTWTTSSSTGNFSQFICTLSNGTCSTTYVDSLAGSVTIAASYSGDSNNPPSSGSSILIVTPSGPIYYSANYTSVQTTIDAAPPGATVIIAAGFYTESLIIDKPLTIIGERDLPVFSGGASAIYLILESGASGSIVTGIEITNWLWGIVIDNVSNVSIYGNVMASIGGSGIVLEGNSATDNSIYGNVFMDVPTPINLTASPGNNNIYGNAFVSETNVAINVGASGNSIYGNTIVGNEIVLNLTGSNSNAVYHNNFVSTTQITVLASGNNTWDTGLPSGGNYWSTTPNIVGGNNTDHFPLTQPFTLIAGHYVGVACVVVSKPVIAQGFSINLTTCLINKGEYAQTFNVTAYANTTAIGLQAVNNLNATGLSILTFKWNTTGLIYGNYMISAYAQPVAGQNDTSGDTFTLGTVKVTIPGDISGDFKVSLADLVLLANAYGSKPGEARWNPNADINDKGVVGLSDLVLLANHYGQHYP